MSDQAAPGWYPVDERTERWWDGTQWSEHQRPFGQGQAPAAPVQEATPYPYGGEAVAQQAPGTYGQGPATYGQVPAYGQAPVHGQPAPKRSVGRIVGAVVVGLIALLFTLVALTNIARNGGDGSRGIGYVIGALLIPAGLWTGFYFLIRSPRR